jgi:hypothetical protein
MKFKTPAANSRFAKAGVWCFYESEVLNSSFVHLMKFSAGNPRLRKAAKRQTVKKLHNPVNKYSKILVRKTHILYF